MMSLEVCAPDLPCAKEYVIDSICSGRLTQLIALTGSSGSWRKTIIDRSIAYSCPHIGSGPGLIIIMRLDGQQDMVIVLQVTRTCTTISESSYTKVYI
jgi:hypothetical protein